MKPSEVKALYLGIPALVLGLLTNPWLTVAAFALCAGAQLAYEWWRHYRIARVRHELLENQARWKLEHGR